VSLPWSEPVRLGQLLGPLRRRLQPDEDARRRIARALGIDALPELSAEVEVALWLDGAHVEGRWQATVVQTCGVTLEPFDTALSGAFSVRALPPGSPHAPAEAAGGVELELSAEDPPDLLAEGAVDLAGYVVEHLALEIDPYPRKPGAEFEPPPKERESSPFDVLQRLKDRT